MSQMPKAQTDQLPRLNKYGSFNRHDNSPEFKVPDSNLNSSSNIDRPGRSRNLVVNQINSYGEESEFSFKKRSPTHKNAPDSAMMNERHGSQSRPESALRRLESPGYLQQINEYESQNSLSKISKGSMRVGDLNGSNPNVQVYEEGTIRRHAGSLKENQLSTSSGAKNIRSNNPYKLSFQLKECLRDIDRSLERKTNNKTSDVQALTAVKEKSALSAFSQRS